MKFILLSALAVSLVSVACQPREFNNDSGVKSEQASQNQKKCVAKFGKVSEDARQDGNIAALKLATMVDNLVGQINDGKVEGLGIRDKTLGVINESLRFRDAEEDARRLTRLQSEAVGQMEMRLLNAVDEKCW
jgi:hypothetical protein